MASRAPCLTRIGGLFFTLVTGPRRSFSLKLSDTIVYEPQIRALDYPEVDMLGVRYKSVNFGAEGAWSDQISARAFPN